VQGNGVAWHRGGVGGWADKSLDHDLAHCPTNMVS
jgi:hypothetical protein